MFRRTIIGGALAVASAAGMVFVTSSSAQAATCYCSYNGSGTTAGQVTVVDDGDHFYVWDTYADGHGVRGYLTNSAGTTLATAYDGSGADSTIAHFQYDVKEGVTYWIKVGTVDGASDTTPSNVWEYSYYE
ncbi:hypothetical protein [Streptomyces griseorubiginosus]|uniref:hypothetical protein n=1 Tax=Streptomyces griseorubiginosus TaxID=67304 RepID=UPI002E814A40|nr:hypothetical protein [Streptomyces griseorubiginosus]WUB48301.1 hypothetical protein OHN19_35155 [Streptomyces griseorubiginosus]WUB56826.1 hypothetical protein OG942_35165 [Streptomyces griseorubiginosus]